MKFEVIYWSELKAIIQECLIDQFSLGISEAKNCGAGHALDTTGALEPNLGLAFGSVGQKSASIRHLLKWQEWKWKSDE